MATSRWGSRSWLATTLAVAALMTSAATGLAAGTPLTGTMVTIEASAGSKTGELEYFFPANTTGQYAWSLNQPEPIVAGDGTVLATLNTLDLAFEADPVVGVDFEVLAGGATTTFDITSATIGFDPLTDPDAIAQATVAVLDTDNSGSVLLAGLMGAGGDAYAARYNGATVWAYLIRVVQACGTPGPGLWARVRAGRPVRPPLTTREPILDTLSSIESQWMFSLTSDDTAIGSSTFDVIPEPATLSLLGVGILLLIRRRRVA